MAHISFYVRTATGLKDQSLKLNKQRGKDPQKYGIYNMNKKALKRSFWAALGRLIGVIMAAGAGSLLYQTIGSSSDLAIGMACGLSFLAFFLIWFAEYERETE
jgi:hypothetical protein